VLAASINALMMEAASTSETLARPHGVTAQKIVTFYFPKIHFFYPAIYA
jgi:hypothetical protein